MVPSKCNHDPLEKVQSGSGSSVKICKTSDISRTIFTWSSIPKTSFTTGDTFLFIFLEF